MTIRFGPFVLDPDRRQLLRDGQDVHLSRKAFEVLRTLLDRRPAVVTKETLYQEIWPQTFVSEANLNVLVGEIRRALGDSAHSPQFIRTAHGVGYAFCADTTAGPEPPPQRKPPAARAWLATGARTFVLHDGEQVIGRDPQCDVWLDDDGVSRRHARIRLSATGEATLEDLHSTNGTFIGRRRVAEAATLSDKDTIRVGEVSLEFRLGKDEPSPTKRIRRR